MKTLFKAIQICFGLFVLMVGVFTRPELVLEPGLAQIAAMLLLIAATVGITFAIQAQFSARALVDGILRMILAGVALVVLIHPSETVAALACLPIAAFVGYWILKRRGAARVTATATAS